MPTAAQVVPVTGAGEHDVPAQMQAACITRHGKTALKLAEMPCPSPEKLEAGYLLLRVHVVSIQPADVKTRNGSVKPIMGKPSDTNPITLGYDCSGTIMAVGPNVVGAWKAGDEVMCVATAGALAPYSAVHEQFLARKPSHVSFAHAAALVTAGLTACQALHYAQDNCGPLHRVFVTAGAGGTGHVALQMAKRIFKATIVATTASATKHDFVRECGADIVIDYKTEDSTKVLSKGKLYDMAVDLTGEAKECKRIVKSGGVVVSLCSRTGGPRVPSGNMLAKLVKAYRLPPIPNCVLGLLNCMSSCAGCCSSVKVFNMVALPIGAELEELGKHVADGTVKVVVDRVYPLEQAPEAFDYVEEGHVVGRVLVEVLTGAAKDVEQVNSL